jgi:hypothetical protein
VNNPFQAEEANMMMTEIKFKAQLKAKHNLMKQEAFNCKSLKFNY